MMKSSLTLLLLALSLLLPSQSAQARGFNMYAAASTGYTLGSIRAGAGNWEGGLLAPGVLGMSKVMSVRHNYYTALGFTVSYVGATSPGLMGAIGFNYKLFWKIGLRGELYAVQAANGFSRGGLLLGLSFNF